MALITLRYIFSYSDLISDLKQCYFTSSFFCIFIEIKESDNIYYDFSLQVVDDVKQNSSKTLESKTNFDVNTKKHGRGRGKSTVGKGQNSQSVFQSQNEHHNKNVSPFCTYHCNLTQHKSASGIWG